MVPSASHPLFDDKGEFVWENDARKLRIWFNVCWISVVCSFAVLFLPGALASLFGLGWIVVFVSAIGSALYTYRVQKALRQHGLARTDPALIAVAAVLFLLPTVLIGAPAVLSNAKKAARRVAEGFTTETPSSSR